MNIDKINLNLLRHVRKIFKNGRKDLGNFELFMKTSEILKKLLEISGILTKLVCFLAVVSTGIHLNLEELMNKTTCRSIARPFSLGR